jgi:outer membrane protein OmpA-like peptidoglycan-associated protein
MLTLLAACSLAQDHYSSTYIVFFPKGSSEVTSDAHTIIAQAVSAIKAIHPATVAIASGVATGDNLRLAEPRYQAIQQALIAGGVPAALIAQSSLPDTKLDVGATGDTRVEILLVSPPARP